MAFDELTGGNIPHAVPIEHNTGAIPGATVVDADGSVIADAGGTTVVGADGIMVADEDTMPIVVVDYR